MALPAGYTQQTYIESDGTQYINTGIYPDKNTKITMDIQPLSEDVAAFFGARTEDAVEGSQSFSVWMINGYYRVDYGDGKTMVSTGSPLSRVTVTLKNGSYSIGSASGTLAGADINPSNPLLLLTTWDIYGEAPDTRMMRARIYSCKIWGGTAGSLMRDYVPCKRNSDNEPGLYDTVGRQFYPLTPENTTPVILSASFSKNPVNMNTSTALTVRVVDAYKGDSDVIKLAADISPLSVGRSNLAAASVGNYAIFAGGADDGSLGSVDTVDAYSASLTRSTPTALSTAKRDLAGASAGNYALFGGGSRVNTSQATAAVDAYNTTLTRSTPTGMSQARYIYAGASAGTYALFAGGNGRSKIVDAYNTSLTRSTPAELSVGRYNLAGASVGDYAIFAGGSTSSSSSTVVVDAYSSSLTLTTPTELSRGRTQLAGASVGSYALFAGGTTRLSSSGTVRADVNAYNTSLTRSTPTALSVARRMLAGASAGNYALFAGGSGESVVDAYNTSLTRSTPAELSAERHNLAGASVGDYAIFAGGQNSSSGAIGTVDVYADINDL